ncbi:MAG: hypothetical protein M3Y28_05240 [Armatimonadota bacterium]|nr:hypothetical protein [Armatimonadota bacterium]
MQTALRVTATVQPGNKIEVTAPELREGESVDVFLILPEPAKPACHSALEFLRSLPQSSTPRAFPTWDEYEAHLQGERNSWDR